MYKCKCGKEYDNKQSYAAHCSHCEINLGYHPKDKFGDSRAWNRGLTKNDPIRGSSIRKPKEPLANILVKGRYFKSNSLKWRLIEEGYKERVCESCNNTHWLGGLIPLELHHKDGDKSNNELDNLELLCPNCHALTDTYRGKNIKISSTKENNL